MLLSRTAIAPKISRPAKRKATVVLPRDRAAYVAILGENVARLRRALDVLEARPGEYLSPEQVAAEAGYSSGYDADQVLLGLVNEGAIDARIDSGIWTYVAPVPRRFLEDAEARFSALFGGAP